MSCRLIAFFLLRTLPTPSWVTSFKTRCFLPLCSLDVTYSNRVEVEVQVSSFSVFPVLFPSLPDFSENLEDSFCRLISFLFFSSPLLELETCIFSSPALSGPGDLPFGAHQRL